jgi:predicted DNA-binding transcriptional regulator AlpA
MHTKHKQRAVIEFLLLDGRSGDEIIIHLRKVYEKAAYSRTTVFRWINQIRSGNSELQSDKSPGRAPRSEMDGGIRNILRDNPFA